MMISELLCLKFQFRSLVVEFMRDIHTTMIDLIWVISFLRPICLWHINCSYCTEFYVLCPLLSCYVSFLWCSAGHVMCKSYCNDWLIWLIHGLIDNMIEYQTIALGASLLQNRRSKSMIKDQRHYPLLMIWLDFGGQRSKVKVTAGRRGQILWTPYLMNYLTNLDET